MIVHTRTLFSFFLPAVLTLLLPFSLVYFYLLPSQYENLLLQKRELIRGVVDNAWKTIDYEYGRFKKGEITEKAIKQHIYEIIEHLRWGPGGQQYFYLFTVEGVLLAHPYSPQLVGRNLKEVREGKGRSLGKLLFKAAENPDDPFVIYYWYKPNSRIMSRKLNYVRTFEPFDWIIGGGVYFDDIDQQYSLQRYHTIFFFLAMTIFIGVLLSIMVFRGLKEEKLRTRQENELRASEQKFRDIYDNTTSFIGLLDSRGRVLDVNRTAVDFLRVHPELLKGKKFWEVPGGTQDREQQDSLRSAYERTVQLKQTQRLDTQHTAPGGQTVLIDFSLKPLFDSAGNIRNFIVQGVDVTEQRRTEEKLRQSQKLDAIGHLAGGIAHDFNNMLGAIMSSADLISMEAEKSPQLQKYTELIINSAENAGKLTNKLLSFSRKGKIASTAIDVHECIKDALDILERTLDKCIQITRNLGAGDSTVIGEPVQIQNAIINLGVNAGHAMPDGGDLSVSTVNVTLDDEACRSLPFELQPGRYISIKVSDTGTGIPREDLGRIFEPFFTTKGIGEGTGLGLATVYGMVKEHHGAVTVESEEGKGTVFVLYLPNETVKVASIKRNLPEEYSGHGCVLVIDDEEIIRTTAMGLLTRLGYEVILANDGLQGIQVYRENRDRIDLVIMDMVMPRMSGSICFRHLREIDPAVRVVLSSGFSQEERIDELKKEGIIAVIEKPYRYHQLARTLYDVLNGKTGS